jgi:hypothetical protein
MGGSIEWAVDKMENTGVVVGKTISLAFGICLLTFRS